MFATNGNLVEDKDWERMVEILRKSNLFYVQRNWTTIIELDKTVMVFHDPTIQDI